MRKGKVTLNHGMECGLSEVFTPTPLTYYISILHGGCTDIQTVCAVLANYGGERLVEGGGGHIRGWSCPHLSECTVTKIPT